MSLISFTPSTSVTVAPSQTQANTAVGGTGRYLRLCNGGQGNAYVRFYEAGTTAPVMTQATSMLLPSGVVEIFSVASDTTMVAYLGDATGTTLNVTRGDGQ